MLAGACVSREPNWLSCCDYKDKSHAGKIWLHIGESIPGLFFGTNRTSLLWKSGGFAMSSRRNSVRLKLRRSFSEQLRSSTSKAWDLLWRNVRERRLAGQWSSEGATVALKVGKILLPVVAPCCLENREFSPIMISEVNYLLTLVTFLSVLWFLSKDWKYDVWHVDLGFCKCLNSRLCSAYWVMNFINKIHVHKVVLMGTIHVLE